MLYAGYAYRKSGQTPLWKQDSYAYNHNLDTSEDYYQEIVTTRSYEDRLKTIENIRKTSITVCSGGIIGMGEALEDRAKMLVALSTLDPQPESVPINARSCLSRVHLLRSCHQWIFGKWCV